MVWRPSPHAVPVGTRVITSRPPLEGVPNLKAAIRYAINHPEGMDPLHALLKPGMKVTVAIDDISMPLPIMRTPDVRQLVLEIVCEIRRRADQAPLADQSPVYNSNLLHALDQHQLQRRIADIDTAEIAHLVVFTPRPTARLRDRPAGSARSRL